MKPTQMLIYTYEWLDFEHYVFLFAADRLINVSTLSCWKKNRFFRLYQVISIDSRQWWSMCPAQQFLMQWQTPWAQEFHHMLRNNVSTVVLHFFQMVLASSVLALDATETVSQTTTEMQCIVELIKAQNLRLRSLACVLLNSSWCSDKHLEPRNFTTCWEIM